MNLAPLIFICDQSPRMNNCKKLDITKAALEAFVSVYNQQGSAQPIMLLGHGGNSDGGNGDNADVSNDAFVVRSSLIDPIGHFENEVKLMSATSERSTQDGSLDLLTESGSSASATDFSKSVDYAFTTLSKFRLRDNIDTFGFGRRLTLAPAHIFIFAEKSSQMGQFKLNKDEGYLNDFVSHPYRWDQHVHLFSLDNGIDSGFDESAGTDERTEVKSGIFDLVYATGGGIYPVSSMKEAHSVMTALVQSILGVAPTVTMRLSISSGTGKNKYVMASMKVPQGERTVSDGAFIPEDILIEAGMESLPQRSSVPTFKLSLTSGDNETVQSCLQALKEVKLPSEMCEVTLGNTGMAGNRNEEITTLGMDSQSYFVSTSGGSGTVFFGIISPDANVGASRYELRILPANFPTLVRVIKSGMRINGNMGGSFGDCQPMLTRFRSEFEEYVSSIPGYCIAPAMKILNSFGIAKIVHSNNPELQQQMQYKLHSRPFNRIQKWMRVAREELNEMEIRVVDSMPSENTVPALNPAALALSSSGAAQQRLPVGPYTRAMPKSVAEVPKKHALAVWESMRRAVFGGTSLVNRGLSTSGLPGNGCRVPAHFKMKDEERIWFESAVGATFIPRIRPRDMSEYVFVLARDESLRDPEAAITESAYINKGKGVAEEDTEQGIIKRKLAAVNFGNRFSNKKGCSGNAQADVLDIDGIGIEGISSKISTTNAKAPSFINSSLVASIVGSGDDLFADTPFRESDIESPSKSPATSHEDVGSLSSMDSVSTPTIHVTATTKSAPTISTGATSSAGSVVPAVLPALPPRGHADVSNKRPREATADAATEWRKEWSKTQKRHYWFNIRTKQSKWDDPHVQPVQVVKQ